MRATFGFDIDGVLYDWHRAAYDYVVFRMGEKRSFEDFWKFTITNKNEPPYDRPFWNNIVRDLTLLTRYGTPKSVPDTVNKLAEDFDIVYITHRPREARWTTYWWLKSNGFPVLPQGENLHVSSEQKDRTIRYFNCEYYVEDRENIIKTLTNITKPIGVRKPWHFDSLEEQGVPHIDSVEELPELIKELENGT